MIGFHVVSYENLDAIFKDGLQPKLGESVIHFHSSLDSVKNEVANRHYDCDLVILLVDLEGYSFKKDHNDGISVDTVIDITAIISFYHANFSEKLSGLIKSNVNDLFFNSVKRNDLTKIEVLLDQGFAYSPEENVMNDTLLHLMVYYDRLEMIKEIVNRGINLEEFNCEGHTALHLAVSKGNIDMVTHLLECGADANSIDMYGWNSLRHAVASQHIDIAKLLIDNGFDVNCKDFSGCTPLFSAILNEDYSFMEFLVRNGADIHVKTDNDESISDLLKDNKSDDYINFVNSFLEETYLSQFICLKNSNEASFRF